MSAKEQHQRLEELIDTLSERHPDWDGNQIVIAMGDAVASYIVTWADNDPAKINKLIEWFEVNLEKSISTISVNLRKRG